MARTLRWALVPVVVVLALVGVGLTTTSVPVTSASADSATQGQTLDSRGPNAATDTVNLDGKIQRVATTCKALKYPDGAYMLEFCYEYVNNPADPSEWIAGWRSMTNIAYPSGHSDYMRYCHFAGGTCSPFAAEGQVKSDGDNYTISDANTFWVEFEVKYGTTWYCRRGFGNHTGSIAFTTCP